MKILTISTYDRFGGAPRAASRLHVALRRRTGSATMLVQHKDGDDDSVLGPVSKADKLLGLVRKQVNLLPLKGYRRENTVFSTVWLPSLIRSRIDALSPDIIHLHWVADGFLSPLSFRHVSRPMVWTLHDMWPFTGGCHYAGDCTRYTRRCGRCPQLRSKRRCDVSYWSLGMKVRAYRDRSITVITPSHWLAGVARESAPLCDKRIAVIPNGIDLTAYAPFERSAARRLLGIRASAKIVLFGAMFATDDRRKGFQLLVPALEAVSRAAPPGPVELLVFGASAPAAPPAFPFPVRYLGRLSDDATLRALYSAADVLLVPSREDNLPLVPLEAMACGTPVVAFDIGGMRDIIAHGDTGYLAKPFDTADLARGILEVLGHRAPGRLRENARKRATTRFALDDVVDRHLRLYEEVLRQR